MPNILDILLIDRTTSTSKAKKNIIWANENYIKHGNKNMQQQLKCDLISDWSNGTKSSNHEPWNQKERQKERTKSKAEVFTPTWIVKKQNDEVEKDYLDDDLEIYVKRTWLEITCGEAPYMATRYDMATSEIVPLNERVGFVDRKLKRINEEVVDKAEWQRLVVEAYKSSYGFEWSGDSLLLAREKTVTTILLNG